MNTIATEAYAWLERAYDASEGGFGNAPKFPSTVNLDFLVRYAARVNGLTALAITKLDVLDTLDELMVCTGYRINGEVHTEFPADLQLLEHAEPVYEVHGVLQIGDEPLTVAYEGWRQHSWGRLDWSDAMLAGVRANGTGRRPRSEWTDSVTTASAGTAAATPDWEIAGPMAGRHAVAHAPFLSQGPSAQVVPILRTFDRVISDGHDAPGWREQLGERR